MAFDNARTCYDTFISGHMFNTVYAALFWSHYYLPTSYILEKGTHNGICKIFWLLFPIAIWILVFWNAAFILGLELHYTTDVGIATVLAFFVWYLSLRESKLGEGFFGWFEPVDSIYRNRYDPDDSNSNPNNTNNTNKTNIPHNNNPGYGMV